MSAVRAGKAWAYREARRLAAQGTDMAVGFQINDVTGVQEWGFCPLAVVGPAFVVDIQDVFVGKRPATDSGPHGSGADRAGAGGSPSLEVLAP
jgi:hypothetical protein